MSGLTPRQREVVWLLAGHTAVQGYPPSRAELARLAGVSCHAVQVRLAGARRKGYVTWDARGQRTLRVLREP